MRKMRVEVEYTIGYEVHINLPKSVIEKTEETYPDYRCGEVAQVTVTKDGTIRFNVEVEDGNDGDELERMVEEKLAKVLSYDPAKPGGELGDITMHDMRILKTY